MESKLATTQSTLDRLKIAAKVASDMELAKSLGLSKQAIADAKSRKTVPSAWIPKAAVLFGVSTDWLFFGTEKKSKGDNSGADGIIYEEIQSPTSCDKCAKLQDKIIELQKEIIDLQKDYMELMKSTMVKK